MRLGRGNCLQTHNIRELKSMCIILYLHDIVLVFTCTGLISRVLAFVKSTLAECAVKQ